MTPSTQYIYFLPASWSRMHDLAAVHNLRRLYHVVAKGELKLDRKGLTIITDSPLAEPDRRSYGLIPFEEL